MKTRLFFTLALAFLAWNAPADPILRAYRAVHSYSTINAASNRFDSVLRLLDHPNQYVRFSYKGTNWIAQHHEWSTNYPNASSVYRVHTSYHFFQTNGGIPVAYWSTDGADVSGPLWDHGSISFMENGDYITMKCSTTMKVYPDTSAPPASVYLMLGYSPFRYWSTNNQAPDVFGRYHFSSNSLPATFTVDPIRYLAAGCASITRPGIPDPEYYMWVSRAWVSDFVCSYTTQTVAIASPSIPLVDSTSPPLPEGVPSPLVIKFTNQVLREQVQLESVQMSSLLKALSKPVKYPPLPPPLGPGIRSEFLDEIWFPPGNPPEITPEEWVKVIEFEGENPYSTFLFMVSSNLVDWGMGGVAENYSGCSYRFTDTNASSGIRFYKVIPVD